MLRDPDHLLLRVLADGVAIVRVDLAEVDIEPHHEPPLAWDEQYVALVRLNCGLQSDVRKVGNRQHVDDPPAMVGKIATRLGAYCATHLAACAIAANDVFGA